MEPVVIEYRPEAFPALQGALQAALQSGARQIVLNLDGVETLESQAIRELIWLLRQARAAGGELVLQAGSVSVLRTLSVTGLDRIFRVVETETA
ncbi:MAG: STAS domain-containing protein [Candidatus Baltobacteraceae bacterium]